MTDPRTLEDLRDLCLWDLAEAARLAARRLPAVAKQAADPGLRRDLNAMAAEMAGRADRLSHAGGQSEGPPNLWMAGMLDDAERDTRTIAEGAKRDIAITGAARKMLLAERASLDTALVVARCVADTGALAVLASCRKEGIDRDANLERVLNELAQQGGQTR